MYMHLSHVTSQTRRVHRILPMTSEQIEAFRSWLYPFGFLSSLAFGLRFLVQWWKSEKAGCSVVPPSFWVLSCIGNALTAIHSLIQLHFPIYFLQSQQLILAWRNLNLMGTNPWTFRRVIHLLITSGLVATLLFGAQASFLPAPSFGWVRAPRVYSTSHEEFGFLIHLIGCLGIAAFSFRFWVQWWEAEKKGKSVLSRRFWWISIGGTATAGVYFFLLSDWVNLIGPLFAIIPYSRNLILIGKEKKERCDVVIIAGETSGDLLGEKITLQMKERHPSFTICGVAGPLMRTAGVTAWMRAEQFSVMGIVDVIKKFPSLFLSIRSLVRRIIDANPAAVLFIDQPSLSIAMAKRLKAKGYSGKLIQVVAPTVWAYRPERADTIASYFDLILFLYRFEIEYFAGKLPAIWVGHPAAELLNNRTCDNNEKTTLALFPGSRIGEIRRNLPLQLKAAALLAEQYPNLNISISSCAEMKSMIAEAAHKVLGSGYELVDFADRYSLMRRSKAAIAKSGTVTLELALFKVPTVCCYQTGGFTRWWAKNILKISPKFFALPNILTGSEVVRECIIPPVTPQALVQALKPYLDGKQRLHDEIEEKLRSQIDAGEAPGEAIAKAVDMVIKRRQ